ncbi:MAG: SDR family NAD(P)-dependent oxidoreductase [Rhizobiaceae bacterium]|nr:SDR family NAD(P)-dependent oxidoreductase [Rhizobiaceae bacterium]
MSDNMQLKGLGTIVTGGGTGIGAAIAALFAGQGARVMVAGRTGSTLQSVANGSDNITAHICDVTKADQVNDMFDIAERAFGQVDVLVNNAGMSGPVMDVADMDMGQFRECVELNLFGALNCMQQAAARMSARKSGSIINMTSLMGLKGYPQRSAYSATKFAIVGMTEALAREVGPAGVRVNALAPGAVSGELMDRLLEKRAKSEGRSVAEIVAENYTSVAALRRWVAPEDVASAALFLASDASSSITGEVIRVDCGRF